jgi:uncharacterized membrane protein
MKLFGKCSRDKCKQLLFCVFLSKFRHCLYRHFSIRQRPYAAALFGLAVALLLPRGLIAQPVARALIGWNVGAALYLALCAVMMC